MAASVCRPEARGLAGAGVRLERLRKRADFVRLREGRKASTATMMVQALPRADEVETTRIGFTVTKKLGGAVVRNRIRRRLREAVRLAAALHAAPGHDYVVVGRRGALDASFATILNDLEATFGRIHAARASRRSAGADRAADEALR